MQSEISNRQSSIENRKAPAAAESKYRNRVSRSEWQRIIPGPETVFLRACDQIICLTPEELEAEFEPIPAANERGDL